MGTIASIVDIVEQLIPAIVSCGVAHSVNKGYLFFQAT